VTTVTITCTKSPILTQERALVYLRQIAELRAQGRTNRERRAYRCLTCGYWHLTSRRGKGLTT
jgi:hypothetical protein